MHDFKSRDVDINFREKTSHTKDTHLFSSKRKFLSIRKHQQRNGIRNDYYRPPAYYKSFLQTERGSLPLVSRSTCAKAPTIIENYETTCVVYVLLTKLRDVSGAALNIGLNALVSCQLQKENNDKIRNSNICITLDPLYIQIFLFYSSFFRC